MGTKPMLQAVSQALGRGMRLAAGSALRSSVVREFDRPDGVRIVTIGGATLGGSGKTPLAIACATHLASTGLRVALVGHAYRARPRHARIVAVDDSLEEVGDEALLAARILAPHGVRVVVAHTRGAAVARAAREADVLVIDGVAQLAPVPASLALLAVDSLEPLGPWPRSPAFGRSVLRAPMGLLLEACDAVVRVVDAERGPEHGQEPWQADAHARHAPFGERPSYTAHVESRGVWVDGGALLTWAALSSSQLRVGLVSALARPHRIERALARRGVKVAAVVRAPDHGPISGRHARAITGGGRQTVDLWLATPKCALHFAAPAGPRGRHGGRQAPLTPLTMARRLPSSDLAVIDHGLCLDRLLRTRLDNLVC